MKKIFAFLLAALCLNTTAQNAKQILDKTAATLKAAGGIEAQFTATAFQNGAEKGQTNGTIHIQGSKFYLTSSGAETWFNGKEMYMRLAGSDEVNLTEPTAAELQTINPYCFLTIYKSGYKLAAEETTYQKQKCQQVTLTAEKPEQTIQTLILIVSPKTNLPLNVRVKTRRGEWTRLAITNVKTGQTYAASHFQYAADKHPNWELIDLR